MFDRFVLSATTDLTLWEKIAEWYQNSFLCELLTYIQESYFTVNFGTYQNFTISETTAETIRLLIPALAVAIVLACLMTARVRVVQGRFVRRLLKGESFSPESAKSLAEIELFRNAAIRRELSRGSNLRMVVRCVHADGRDTGVGVYLDRSSEELEKLFPPEEEASLQKAGSESPENESVEKPTSTPPEDLEPCADAVEADAQKVEDLDAETPENTEKEAGDVREKRMGTLPKIDFTTARFYIPEGLKHRADIRFDRRGSSWAPAIASIALVIFMTSIVCWLLPYVLTLADGIISLAAPE